MEVYIAVDKKEPIPKAEPYSCGHKTTVTRRTYDCKGSYNCTCLQLKESVITIGFLKGSYKGGSSLFLFIFYFFKLKDKIAKYFINFLTKQPS